MKTVCAWCQKVLTTTAKAAAGTSHGICDKCAKEVKKQIEDAKRKRGK